MESLPKPLALEEAQSRLLALAGPKPGEKVAVADALGRYLATPVIAARTQPAADVSAMDGHACAGEGPWQHVGESAAGHPFHTELQKGECVTVSTGALMPRGADRIVLREWARLDSALLTSSKPPEPGRHIRRKGNDFNDGDMLVEAGAAIGPAEVALALSGGHETLPVRMKPSVAILDSGDELSTSPAECEAHQIPASNGAMLTAMVTPYAGRIDRIGPVSDQLDALADALRSAEGADVLVTSGGASVGEHDLLRQALADWGAELSFWRVAMKPGKPLIVAKRGQQVILGLPGNPVSSFVTAYLFLLPLLRAMAGAARPLPETIMAPLACNLDAGGDRLEMLRMKWTESGLVPSGQQDSSMLSALAAADVLAIRPAGTPRSVIGDLTPVYPIRNGAVA